MSIVYSKAELSPLIAEEAGDRFVRVMHLYHGVGAQHMRQLGATGIDGYLSLV